MSYQAIREYLKVMLKRYQKANKLEKGQLLTEMSFVTELSRKDLIRLMNQTEAEVEKAPLPGRPLSYDPELLLPLLAINIDSGSEFLNTPVLQWMRGGTNEKPVTVTRSRPYKKNDNCYVEQRNFTHVGRPRSRSLEAGFAFA